MSRTPFTLAQSVETNQFEDDIFQQIKKKEADFGFRDLRSHVSSTAPSFFTHTFLLVPSSGGSHPAAFLAG
jgi:hypothetical protein